MLIVRKVNIAADFTLVTPDIVNGTRDVLVSQLEPCCVSEDITL